MSTVAKAWFLEKTSEPLVQRDLQLPDPGSGEAVIEVLACGLCHTDLGFFSGAVPTASPLPIVLGHEVVGTVVAAGPPQESLVGHPVIVPAILPCGECVFCRAGRGNACPQQKFPGSDTNGGFATHMLVPSRHLIPLDCSGGTVDRRSLAVVADAVTTAWQAVRRCSLQSDDLAVVVGAGGVGGFVIQFAHALGARAVACDVSQDRLALVSDHGADIALDVSGRSPRDVRKEVHGFLRDQEIPSLRLRIFECSGTPVGQELAFGLLARGATLVQVGYTPKKVSLRLSNLMAFDATVHGTWACPPEAYPDVLQLIFEGKVVLDPFVDYAPMSRVNELLQDMANHKLQRRMVLDPKE